MKFGASIFLFISILDHQTNSSKWLFKVVHQRDLLKWLYWKVRKSWVTSFLLSTAVYPFRISLMPRQKKTIKLFDISCECQPWCKMVRNTKKGVQNTKKVTQNVSLHTFCFSHFNKCISSHTIRISHFAHILHAFLRNTPRNTKHPLYTFLISFKFHVIAHEMRKNEKCTAGASFFSHFAPGALFLQNVKRAAIHFVFHILRIFCECFRETHHEIRNTHYTLFVFHANFVFY